MMREDDLRRHLSGLPVAICAVGVLAWACAAQAVAVSVGPTDPISVAQPQIIFDMIDPNTGLSDGPDDHFLLNRGLADTGANGVLLARGAYLPLVEILPGFEWPSDVPQPDRYDVQVRTSPPIDPVQYLEQGVAGSDFLDVLELYDIDLNATDGTTRTLEDFRALGSVDLDLGAFPAVVGMPAFWNTVTRLDQTMLHLPIFDPNNPDAFPHIGTGFMPALPAPTAGSYHIDLRILPPVHTGQQIPDPDDPNDARDPDPLPDFTGLPVIDGVTFELNGNIVENQTVLVDTGAQTSILFSALADGLNIDWQNVPADQLIEVGGLGGTLFAPVVEGGDFTLPTQEGVGIQFEHNEYIVFDIDGLEVDAIIGMNVLNTGWLATVLADLFTLFDDGSDDVLNDFVNGSVDADVDLTQIAALGGAFDDIYFDFTEATRTANGGMGVMRLEMNPDFTASVIPTPTVVVMFTMSCCGLLARRPRNR